MMKAAGGNGANGNGDKEGKDGKSNSGAKGDALAGLKRDLEGDSDLEDNADTLEANGEATSEPLTVQEEVERLLKKSKATSED